MLINCSEKELMVLLSSVALFEALHGEKRAEVEPVRKKLEHYMPKDETELILHDLVRGYTGK